MILQVIGAIVVAIIISLGVFKALEISRKRADNNEGDKK